MATTGTPVPETTVDCSDCGTAVAVDFEEGRATARKPSNGKRGQGHVPAHNVIADVVIDADETLAHWECPVCGYTDSTYVHPAMREALA